MEMVSPGAKGVELIAARVSKGAAAEGAHILSGRVRCGIIEIVNRHRVPFRARLGIAGPCKHGTRRRDAMGVSWTGEQQLILQTRN